MQGRIVGSVIPFATLAGIDRIDDVESIIWCDETIAVDISGGGDAPAGGISRDISLDDESSRGTNGAPKPRSDVSHGEAWDRLTGASPMATESP